MCCRLESALVRSVYAYKLNLDLMRRAGDRAGLKSLVLGALRRRALLVSNAPEGRDSQHFQQLFVFYLRDLQKSVLERFFLLLCPYERFHFSVFHHPPPPPQEVSQGAIGLFDQGDVRAALETATNFLVPTLKSMSELRCPGDDGVMERVREEWCNCLTQPSLSSSECDTNTHPPTSFSRIFSWWN